LWARKRIDITAPDLIYAVRCCLSDKRSSTETRRDETELTCLSLRSGLDLWLGAANYPNGAEILISAITIPDMTTIIEAHGFVAVPIDITDSVCVDPNSLNAAVSSKTCAIVVAHLFGSVGDMDAVIDVAKQHNLGVFEDCAQAFQGEEYKGHPESDVVAWSFGPIKTATALGGATLTVRNSHTLERMQQLADAYPVQSNMQYLKRIGKYAVLTAIGHRIPYRILAGFCKLTGKNFDATISGLARNFGKKDLLVSLRQQPSKPLQRMIHHRISTFSRQRLQRQRALAIRFSEICVSSAVLSGERVLHSYWLLPIRSNNADELVGALKTEGFDATTSNSLIVVNAPSGMAAATNAERLMAKVVYVPLYAAMPEAEIDRLALLVEGVNDAP